MFNRGVSTFLVRIPGTPVGTDRFIQTHVAQNCLKIMANIAKHEPLDDGLVHFQLLKFCMNTRSQYLSANVSNHTHFHSLQHQHVDRYLANNILQKGTRCLSLYGMTPNAIAQISVKVAMASRFLSLVGSLPSSEQALWFPHQNVKDPNTWTIPHLIQLSNTNTTTSRICTIV